MAPLSTLKMERNSSQKPENVATNMPRSKDPAEIGNNADAVFPWAGAGAGDISFTGPLVEASAACWGDGEACGERPPAGAAAGVSDNPQLVAEGAETLQAAGRVVALVTFKTTPN